MGARKFAAWLGLVEDGRYQSDEELEIDGDLTDDVYVEDEPSQEISRVSPLPTRRPKPVPPTAAVQKEMADLSRIVSVRPRSYNEARIIGENFRIAPNSAKLNASSPANLATDGSFSKNAV